MELMKRTITLRVEVDDADDYADAVAAIVQHPRVIQSAWTRGDEIKQILETKHGMTVDWAQGAGAEWIAKNS
jgi:hypothetical protein